MRRLYRVGALFHLHRWQTKRRIRQYHTDQFVSAYDSIADFPDRPDNLFALANSIAGLATGHTAIAFTNPSSVPPQNIRTTLNSRDFRPSNASN